MTTRPVLAAFVIGCANFLFHCKDIQHDETHIFKQNTNTSLITNVYVLRLLCPSEAINLFEKSLKFMLSYNELISLNKHYKYSPKLVALNTLVDVA